MEGPEPRREWAFRDRRIGARRTVPASARGREKPGALRHQRWRSRMRVGRGMGAGLAIALAADERHRPRF